MGESLRLLKIITRAGGMTEGNNFKREMGK